ncbi:hypothetical protein [Streptomyces sp.]|uniref:hypothetical protein n=1 Tax=Streptomyces sp. TaxID=1931 RepID=UPI002F943D43
MPPETPETATEVPAELVAILGQRMYDASHESCDDYCHGAPLAMFETIARDHLAAVLPAHEAMVRAKVVREIAAPTVWPDPFGRWTADQADAAKAMKEHILRRIARGERP